MDPLAKLAQEVIAVLNMQQEYFKTRSTEKLHESKRAERRLRERCRAIINPPAKPQPGLFDEPQPAPAEPPKRLTPGAGRCVAVGCGAEIRTGYLMCGRHWRLVPTDLQRRLYAVLEQYRSEEATLEQLREVQRECVRAVRE